MLGTLTAAGKSLLTPQCLPYTGAGIALCLLLTAALWRIFQKSGMPGWACLIPLYNVWVFFRIAWGTRWMLIVFFLMSAGAEISLRFSAMAGMRGDNSLDTLLLTLGVTLLAALVILTFTLYFRLARVFGKKRGFGLGLMLLPPVFFPVLAFGKSRAVLKGPVSSES